MYICTDYRFVEDTGEKKNKRNAASHHLNNYTEANTSFQTKHGLLVSGQHHPQRDGCNELVSTNKENRADTSPLLNYPILTLEH